MELRYTQHFLHKLESVFAETEYHLRYEKGSFRAGYCLLKDVKVAVVNKYFTTEGKINCLLEMLRTMEIDADKLSPKSKQLFLQILANAPAS